MGGSPRGDAIDKIAALGTPQGEVPRVLGRKLWARPSSKGAESKPARGGASIGRTRPNPLGGSPGGDTIEGIVALGAPNREVPRDLVVEIKYNRGSK